MMHSLYFFGFAIAITFSVIVVIWAQYARYKNDGTPFNFTILKILAALALIMWTGAAQTVYFYDIQPITAAWAAFALGITITIIGVWGGSEILKDWNIITEISTRDTVTGLWDRRVFDVFLHAEIERSNRINLPLSIVMLHLDNMEDIEKNYGRKGRKKVLQEFGKRLSPVIRANDLLCCYQEATFVLLLPHTDQGDTLPLAKRLMDILKEPFVITKTSRRRTKHTDEELMPTVWSAGVASYTECTYPRKTDEDVTLLSRVLGAMEKAQEKGDNSIFLCEKDECREI